MKTTLIILMLFVALTVTGQPTIDLFKLTLNDSILKELNVERLTNILGRPSAIKKNESISDIAGPQIYYHSKGLDFMFKAKKWDTQQRLSSITIHLTREWDEDHNEFFNPFLGTLLPNLNANMKTYDILPLFKDYKIKIQSAEERNKENEEGTKRINEISRQVGLPIRDVTVHNDMVAIQNTYGNVNLFCEELTKYIEFISINFDKPNP